jgi:molybdopterin-dependent oxidoreductase alpha subunit
VLKGVLKELIANDKVDHGFIAEHTDGYEALRADIEASSWDDIVAGSGVDRETIHAMAKIVGDAKRVICCWAMGLTQHEEAVGTIQMVVNLLLLGGHMGRPGAGACPVRGHSNVQGDRTMGIYEKMPDPFLDRLGATFGFEPPRRHGLDTIDTIKAMRAGDIDVFFAMGGNFLSAAPDTLATAEGLRNCRLTVHVSTKPNRSHVVHGETALILPCLGRTERDQPVSVEDSMSMVHLSRGNLEPASEHLLSEVDIVCRVADAVLGPDSGVPWKSFSSDYDQIREKIEAVVPGFENYNQRVRQPGGFLLPNGARERSFDTATGNARFTVHAIPPRERPQGSLVMMTIRTHDQYNTTVYGLDDRYRGIHGGRRVVLMNGNDQAAFGVSSGDRVDLVSRYDGVERRAEGFQVVDYPIPRGCCATFFPEANVLVPLGRSARKSNTPISKSVVVFVEKAGKGTSTQS